MQLFKQALEASWSKETSYTPDAWSRTNPALGQCAPTALILQDYLAGEIVWSEVQLPNGTTASHLFNRVNGQEVDWTRDQFPHGSVVPAGMPKLKGYSTTRDWVLSYDTTRIRYGILRASVSLALAAQCANH